MPIRWNAAAVAEICDEAEKLLAPALPIIDRAMQKLTEIAALDNIPQYIANPARGAEQAIKYIMSKARDEIAEIRTDIPKAEVAKSKYRGTAITLGLAEDRTLRKPEADRFKEWRPGQMPADTQTSLGLR